MMRNLSNPLGKQVGTRFRVSRGYLDKPMPAQGISLRHDLFAYIEGYYNRQRLHSALGYITPEQAERQAA